MHQHSITYYKLKEHIAQTKQRIRSQIELIFQELLCIDGSKERLKRTKYTGTLKRLLIAKKAEGEVCLLIQNPLCFFMLFNNYLKEHNVKNIL
jgi:hypothetical protein